MLEKLPIMVTTWDFAPFEKVLSAETSHATRAENVSHFASHAFGNCETQAQVPSAWLPLMVEIWFPIDGENAQIIGDSYR